MEGGEEKQIDAIIGAINNLNLIATFLPVNHSKVKKKEKKKVIPSGLFWKYNFIVLITW